MAWLSEYRTPVGMYAFHRTQQEYVEPILAEGILCDEPGDVSVQLIEEALDELGYEDPFPFDRTEVTYCHLDGASIEESYRRWPDLSADEAVLVVDLQSITAPMYLADMSVISDLIDYRAAAADVMIHADSPHDIVQLYRESIVQVDGPEDIRSAVKRDREHTELVVAGDISPDAIVDVHRAPPTNA